MDYLDTLPGARVFRVATETREAIEAGTTRDAVQSTMTRHRDALDKLSRL